MLDFPDDESIFSESLIENLAHTYQKRMARRLLSGLFDERSMDMKLVCQGMAFTGNKLMLAASSKFFYDMFSKHAALSFTRVFLPEIDPQALKIILQYIHSGRKKPVDAEKGLRDKIFNALQHLGMTQLRRHRLDIMSERMDPRSFYSMWQMATSFKLPEIEAKIASRVLANLQSCAAMQEFCYLRLSQMLSLLSRYESELSDLITLAVALNKWVTFNSSYRFRFLTALLIVLKVPYYSRIVLKLFIKYNLSKLQASAPVVLSKRIRLKIFNKSLKMVLVGENTLHLLPAYKILVAVEHTPACIEGVAMSEIVNEESMRADEEDQHPCGSTVSSKRKQMWVEMTERAVASEKTESEFGGSVSSMGSWKRKVDPCVFASSVSPLRWKNVLKKSSKVESEPNISYLNYIANRPKIVLSRSCGHRIAAAFQITRETAKVLIK